MSKHNLELIGNELKLLKRWIGWRAELVEERGSLAKIPYSCMDARQRAATDKPETWTTFKDAIRARDQFAGLGFVLGEGIVGIDLDKCRDEKTGALEEWAHAIVRELDSYAEVSPSGTGVHIWVRGALPPGKRRNGRLEMYNGGRYFTVTGKPLPGTSLAIAARDLASLHARFERGELIPKTSPKPAQQTNTVGCDGVDGSKFERLLRGDWKNLGYRSQSEADLAFAVMLAAAHQCDSAKIDAAFRQSSMMRGKWDEKHGAQTYGAATIEKAIRSVASAQRTSPFQQAARSNLPPGFMRVSDVQPARQKWLWKHRIPSGAVTILDGDPGLGKSVLTLDIAARVTTGRPMPGESKGNEPGTVIVLSAEDTLRETIRPRLDAADADVSRVIAFNPSCEENPLTLPGDIERLQKLIQSTDAKLLIADPLVAYLGEKVDSHRDKDVRRAMGPLARMCERTSISTIGIRHLNKVKGGTAVYRGGGSIAIIGAARAGYLVAPDPDEEGVNVLAAVKANLAPPMPALKFKVVTAAMLDHTGELVLNGDGEPEQIPLIEWLGISQHSANDLVTDSPGEDASSKDRAVEFWRTVLADGPRPTKEVEAEARKHGDFSIAVLRKARTAARVRSIPPSICQGEWYVELIR